MHAWQPQVAHDWGWSPLERVTIGDWSLLALAEQPNSGARRSLCDIRARSAADQELSGRIWYIAQTHRTAVGQRCWNQKKECVRNSAESELEYVCPGRSLDFRL